MPYLIGLKTMLWWADGLIDDGSFVSGMQWLISNGVIMLESEANNQEDEEGRCWWSFDKTAIRKLTEMEIRFQTT